MSHQIELEDLQKWIEDDQLMLFASSTKDDKQLYATMCGSYEVHQNGEVVHVTIQPYSAVEYYNKI